MLLHDLIPIIQVSASPVIFISGVGLILLSMTNRYGRVIDKARILLEKLNRGEAVNRSHVMTQLLTMFERCRSLRFAISLACLSLLLMALLIGLLFIFNLFHLELALLLVVLFVGSMVALSDSLISFLLDINTSLNVLSIEVRILQETPVEPLKTHSHHRTFTVKPQPQPSQIL
jgi:hypothetical protein